MVRLRSTAESPRSGAWSVQMMSQVISWPLLCPPQPPHLLVLRHLWLALEWHRMMTSCLGVDQQQGQRGRQMETP